MTTRVTGEVVYASRRAAAADLSASVKENK